MAPQRDWNALAGVIEETEAGGGTVGIAVIGPEGETFAHHGTRLFRAASTMKIPLMVELLRQVDRGVFALDDAYTLTAADKTPGSGVLLDLHDGLTPSYRDLIYLMISISDNTATNILLDRAGMAAVNATMRDLGMPRSTVARKMRGRAAEPGEAENWAAPEEYAAVLAAILADRAASPDACAFMRATLQKQQNPRRFARYIPAGGGIVWGSKTGSIAGVCNDVGYLTTPVGTLIVSAFCENLADPHVAERMIGLLARAAMVATGVVGPLPIA